MHRAFGVIANVFALSMFASVVAADEAAEKYIKDAAPLMHHSCASLGGKFKDDKERIIEVVKLMVAVTLYNREIVITDYASTDEEKQVLREKFAARLKRGCDEDPNALLAGVVDRAVVHALKTD